MRVCIPIEFLPQGGGFYFLRSFSAYLQARTWAVSSDVSEKSDVLFTNHWMTPKSLILKAIRANPDIRIVQRIDGAAQDYGRDAEADERQGAVNKWADLTIFQSEYCKYATRKKFNVIRQDGPVIHNPVDIELFRPAGNHNSATTRVASISWSTNKMKGAGKIYETAKANPEVDFLLCGNFPDAPALPNLKLLGVLGRSELAETLGSCDVLLTFSQNEACPNHVLEALACGLPVLYDDSGAMKEVIGDCGLPVTVDTFPSGLAKIMSDRKRLSSMARQRALDSFHPDKIFGRYMAEIQNSVVQAPRVRLLRAWAGLLAGARI